LPSVLDSMVALTPRMASKDFGTSLNQFRRAVVFMVRFLQWVAMESICLPTEDGRAWRPV